MTIRLELTIETGETLQQVLGRAGLLPVHTVHIAPQSDLDGLREAFADARPVPVITPAEAAEQAGLEPPTTLHARVQTETAPEQPAPRRRGRPPKSQQPTTIQEVAAQAPETVYLVRRYGGEADTEHSEPETAAARLIELVNNAGTLQALESLSQHNEALAEQMPEEIAEGVSAAFDQAFAALTPQEQPEPAQPAPPAAAAPVAWPFCEDRKTPLTQVTLSWQGARDALFAIATGPKPQFGVPAGQKMLESFGVPKLSALAQDDPKVLDIARKAAEMLGLPVAEETLV